MLHCFADWIPAILAVDNTSPFLIKSGVLYVENDKMIITGSLSSNSLQLKCKGSNNCDNEMSSLEKYFSDLA